MGIAGVADGFNSLQERGAVEAVSDHIRFDWLGK
jgi:hypothetical protein